MLTQKLVNFKYNSWSLLKVSSRIVHCRSVSNSDQLVFYRNEINVQYSPERDREIGRLQARTLVMGKAELMTFEWKTMKECDWRQRGWTDWWWCGNDCYYLSPEFEKVEIFSDR